MNGQMIYGTKIDRRTTIEVVLLTIVSFVVMVLMVPDFPIEIRVFFALMMAGLLIWSLFDDKRMARDRKERRPSDTE